MKIESLEIKGFRSLKNVIWHPGDLNVVIGQNGTGKSNLLRMMEFIRASSQGFLGKYIQRAGGMEAILWDGRADEISFRFNGAEFEKNNLTYEIETERLGKTSSFRIKKETLFYQVEGGKDILKLLERTRAKASLFHEKEKTLITREDFISEEETLLSQTKGPFSLNRDIALFQETISSWAIYHDINVHLDSEIRRPVIARYEEQVNPDGQNLISVLHTLYTGNRIFKKDIDCAMIAAFGNDYDELVFPPASDQRIQLRLRWKSLQKEQASADLSDGTLRFLFLLTVLSSPSLPGLIAIDEPETGLHPSMLPIIAEYAFEAAERSQIIFTTHSPQFLDAFKETIPVTTVARWANGETHLNTVKGEELNYWLKEYSLGSLFKSGELEDME